MDYQITGAKLLSNQDIMVLFFNMREVKLTVQEIANIVICVFFVFWEKNNRILCFLINVERLRKNCRILQVTEHRQDDLHLDLDNLTVTAYGDAVEKTTIEEDEIFLQRKTEPSHPVCLECVPKKFAELEKILRQRKMDDDAKNRVVRAIKRV